MKIYLSFPGRKYDFCITSLNQMPELADLLKILYGEYCVETPKRALWEIEIKDKGRNQAFDIIYDDKKFMSDTPVQDVLKILFQHPNIEPGVIALHGAAVEHCGKAHVFLAATKTGKSTLASYLTSQGLGYISEDCVLIRKKERCVIPCTIPVHLREGGKKVLDELGIQYEYSCVHLANVERYIYCPEKRVADELPIGAVYFITRNNLRNEVRRCDKAASFEKLLQAPITVHQVDGEYIRTLLALTENIYDVMYKDMEYIYRAVCNIDG